MTRTPPLELLRFVHDLMPPGATRDGIAIAMALPLSTGVRQAAAVLGNGARITCPDTVPFCLWNAARHLDDYVGAMWTTVSAEGDIDTNCAIVGGIVSLSAPNGAVPTDWITARGPLRLDLSQETGHGKRT
jgi:hypothetical protein